MKRLILLLAMTMPLNGCAVVRSALDEWSGPLIDKAIDKSVDEVWDRAADLGRDGVKKELRGKVREWLRTGDLDDE